MTKATLPAIPSCIEEIISTNPGHEVSFEGNRHEHSPKWPTRVVETAKVMQAQPESLERLERYIVARVIKGMSHYGLGLGN